MEYILLFSTKDKLRDGKIGNEIRRGKKVKNVKHKSHSKVKEGNMIE